MRFRFCSRSLRTRIDAVALMCACLLGVIAASAIAAGGPRDGRSAGRATLVAHAYAARLLPPRLRTAAARSGAAERAFVATARSLHGCRVEHARRPRRCSSLHDALQRTGRRLRRAQRELAAIAVATSGARPGSRARASRKRAPVLTVSGETLDWTRVDALETYVLKRKVRGQAAQYSLVSGGSTTPPPVPGATVGYAVRTSVVHSAWSEEVTIAYPPASGEAPAPDPQSAPDLTVSGETLEWGAVANVQTYVLATEVPGRANQYSVVSGTSITPPAVPGATVGYTIRTAVEGSAWSPTVEIAYPAAAPAHPPAEELAGGQGELQTGLNSGTYEFDFPATTTLGAKLVRLPFTIEDGPAQLAYAIEKYAAEGVRVLPLAVFDGTIPTPAQAQSLASWASTYGPGGTFWAGRSDGAFAIESIEFGNETSYSYQYSEAEDTPGGYAARAQAYAQRFVEAAKAIRAANPDVGLLAQGDAGNAGAAWVENMFKAVPDLAQYVAGWTIHPYGPNWRERVEAMIWETAAQGAPATIPVDITEFGLSTDNGQCLTGNYGWPVCMTYQEAAELLTRTMSELHQVLNGRPGMFLLYTITDRVEPGVSNEREDYFGALQSSLKPKGAFTTAVEAMLADGA
jgi:hypothetical protein